MRIWSVHPNYLDAKGLVAGWRETLLAQKVLQGQTKGYRNHPQLARFRAAPDPLAAIGAYLAALEAEASSRGYNFDRNKIVTPPPGEAWRESLTVTGGQLDYELEHLRRKLTERDPARLETPPWEPRADDAAHPLFRIVPGDVEEWEVRA